MSSSPYSLTDDDDDDFKTTVVTDADIEQLEKFLPPYKKNVSRHELRVRKAAKDLLLRSSAIISMVSLMKNIEIDAANFLVDQCLFLSTDDLFQDVDDTDPEGYIKYVPDDVDFQFIGRLVSYNINPTSYFKSIDLPEVWKSRLSANGIKLLRDMKFYRNILDSSPPPESSSNIQLINDHNNERNQNSSSILREQSQNLISNVIEMHQQIPSKYSKKPYHQAGVFSECQAQMEWKIVHMPGCGLINQDENGNCKNMCYINAIIQCFANTAPFVQWLLADRAIDKCDLTSDGQFCSVCVLHSIIRSIHHNINNERSLSSILSYTTAGPLAKQITELSSTFTIGHQEDPSELLIFLLDHLKKCVTSTESSIDINSSITPIECMFGFNAQFISKCNVCSLESVKEDWQNVWYVHVLPYSTLIEALTASFSNEELDDKNLYICTNCKIKVPSSRKINIIQSSPIIFIILRRFSYDQFSKMTNKIHQFITYPETLNLTPYFDKNIQESIKENDAFNNFTYRLNAVVVHLGKTADSGHIFTYIRAPDGFWYKANDESVTRVKLDKVLADKDAYILCYVKVPIDTVVSTDTELIIPPLQLPSLFTSSTPIRPSKDYNNIINNYTTTNLSKNIYVCPDEYLKKNPTNNNLLSTDYSSILNDEMLSDHSSTPECLTPVKIQSFAENSTECNTFQTESRIEIIPNKNNIQKYLNRKLSSSINTRQIDNFHEFVSPGGTLTSSTSPPEHLSSTRFQREQPFSTTSENEQSSSSISELEELSSPPSKNISSKISSSIQLNVTVADSQVGDDFIAELSSCHEFTVRPVDLAKLLVIRNKKLNKKKARLFEQMGLSNVTENTTSKKIFISKQNKLTKSTISKTAGSKDLAINIESEEKKQSNVDVEYLYVLLPYIKQFNKYCGLCVRLCTFGETSIRHRQLLRCNLRCIGHPICPFTCSVIVQNNGVGHIMVTNRTVRHARGVKICRPIRAPLRSSIKKKFAQGASVFRLHQEKLQQRTLEQKKGQNYDGIGKSRNIFRKIKSEGIIESLLAPDVDQALFKLFEKFRVEINPDGKVKGAIQHISKYPYQIIGYTETSIRLFDTLLKHKNVILSWDATGSIIKETSSRRVLYYELSITLPGIVNEDSIVPITFMVSDAHALVDVIHWLQLFKHNYSQVFPGKQFPQPQMVLSDRAQVFLIASLRVWNNETMNDFLQRAYRIITGNNNDSDNQKTNIHACLSHVLLDARKIINKYIPEQYRNLAMWCIALLVNTSTWNEFIHNWELICFVFLQLHLDEKNVNVEYQDALMDKIRKIHNDPNTNNGIKLSENLQDEDSYNMFSSNIYDYNESDEEFDEELSEHVPRSKRKKLIIDEEKEANATDSPFKSTFNRIFVDALTTCGLSIKEFQSTTTRGILKWFKYLTAYFMPTAVVWSNLLLGDLSRHRRRIVRSFETITIHKEEQRTTAISERRMGILKRTQLGGEVHMRIDVLLSILIPDMLSMVDEFWNTLLSYCTTSIDNSNADSTMILDEQRLKPIEERWRQNVSKRGSGHYAKCPDEPVFTDLLSSLLTSQVNINENIKLPTVSPNWLNIAIGMLLSLGYHNILRHQSTSPSTNDSSLISDILTFLEEWCNSSTSTNNIVSTSINFSLSNDELNKSLDQSTYILEKILIPLLPCHLIINKVYICKSCQSTVKIRSTITSIPVSVSRSGLHLERDLCDFFTPTTSDLLCSLCKKPTIRHIEVIQWPQVLLINIHDSKQNIKYRKPPGVLSLVRFSSWLAIGCPSASIYDLICFNSVIQYGGNETMVRITKVKKSWSTNINKRVIGEGEQLQRLYAHSRILIFERIHHQNKFNFIYAIFQCTLNKPSILLDDIPACETLQEACSIIETHPALNELNNTLVANIITYFYCHSCHEIPDSLRIQNTQIFIFKLTSKNEIIAYPIIAKINNEDTAKKYCSYCDYSSEDMEMNVCKQVFVECPSCLIQFVDKKIHVKELFESTIKLTDNKNIDNCYKPTAILLISRYSNTATVIKHEADTDNYIQFNDHIYSEPKQLSYSKIADLLDTSGFILVFYHQIHSTASSQMRIISNTNVNGVQRIVIQSGDRFFAITPAPSNTTTT